MKNLSVKELKEILSKYKDEDVINFYVWDYEYDEEEPQELGVAKFIDNEDGLYFNLGLHCGL